MILNLKGFCDNSGARLNSDVREFSQASMLSSVGRLPTKTYLPQADENLSVVF